MLFLVAANLVIVILVTVTSKTSYRGVPVYGCVHSGVRVLLKNLEFIFMIIFTLYIFICTSACTVPCNMPMYMYT